MEELKYNYVIIGSEGYYLVGYRDIIGLPSVSYHRDYYDGFNGYIARKLVRWNFSRKINKYIHTPFSWYVFPRLYPHHFGNSKPVCYLFFGNRQYIYQTPYMEYLRRRQPKAKFVLYMQDLISRNRGLRLAPIASKFDLLVSYDMGDAERYGMEFHPTPMSHVEVQVSADIPKCDVYFCGYAKNRYDMIHQVYEQCVQQGLTCDFYILDMPQDARRIDGIHYIERPFDYLTNLQHVIRARCVLEIMQEGADGFTPRLWESIVYDRHLLTNNGRVFCSPYCFAQGCHSIASVNSGEIKNWICKPVSYPDSLKDSLSPRHLLQFVDQKLSAL